MNKDGRFSTLLCFLLICNGNILAVQNERGPRQPFPDRHMHLTGSFGIKPEVR